MKQRLLEFKPKSLKLNTSLKILMAEESVVVSVIEVWKRFGIFDFVLPFLLIFGIVYGILERTKIFGEKTGRSVNAIIAFTIAMISSLTGWFIGFLTGFLPYVSMISIIIVAGLKLDCWK